MAPKIAWPQGFDFVNSPKMIVIVEGGAKEQISIVGFCLIGSGAVGSYLDHPASFASDHGFPQVWISLRFAFPAAVESHPNPASQPCQPAHHRLTQTIPAQLATSVGFLKTRLSPPLPSRCSRHSGSLTHAECFWDLVFCIWTVASTHPCVCMARLWNLLCLEQRGGASIQITALSFFLFFPRNFPFVW